MAIKKTELYSTLWSGCDELRGGMDASQYKDYVLTLLFMKYVSDAGIIRDLLVAAKVVLPSVEEQAIAAVLFNMDAEIDALEFRRAKTQSLKQGMIQELLTGRTRLV